VEYFFQYLNSEVGVLSDHLYFDAFSILLAHVWTVIVKVPTPRHAAHAHAHAARHTDEEFGMDRTLRSCCCR
jgi:hypothetical protein